MYVGCFAWLKTLTKPHLHPLFTTRRHYKGTKTSRSTDLGFRTTTYGEVCTNSSSSIINNYLGIVLNVSCQVMVKTPPRYRTIVLREASARAGRDKMWDIHRIRQSW